MTPKAYLNTLAVLLALASVGGGAYAVWSYKHMAQQAAEVAPLRQQVETLKHQQEALASEVVTRAELDKALRERRQNISASLDKATNENPEARAYLSERIPDSVRDAYRAGRSQHRAVPTTDHD